MNRLIELLSLQGHHIERIRTGMVLLFITLAAKPAADLTWRLIGIGGDGNQMTAVSQSVKPYSERKLNGSVRRNGQAATSSAADLHLFGKAGRITDSAPSEMPLDVPKTSLNLILKGVVAATPMDRALAVINEKGGKKEDELYGVGDKVMGMAEIREIYADRVILRRGGKLETLMLEESEDTGVVLKADRGNSVISDKGDGLNWNIASAYWNRQINDIPSLAKQVGVDIYRENNVQKGFKLLSSRGNKLLSDLGLQPGDVLYEVNGIKLTNAHNGLMAYQQIKGASQVTLKIGRNGRVMTRIYTIN